MDTWPSYTNTYIGISSRMMKWGVFCLVNELLCVTYYNIATLHIVKKVKGHTNPMFAFNMQTPDQV